MSVATPSLTLADYLEKLPGTTFRRLYQQPSTAFAIFRRMLTHLAKTIVMAVLYMPSPLLLSDLDTWVKPEAKKQRDQALSVLRRLHIVSITVPARDRPQEMALTTNFRNSLRQALEGGGTHNSFGVESAVPPPSEVDVAFLDRYARKKWEDILHYVVNSVGMATSGHDPSSGPKASVKELLVAGRLVERRPGHSGVSITQSGFTFLLQEANAQVWTLLLQWLEAADSAGREAGMDSVDMLSFLFMLGSLELGRAYDTDALTEPRRNMLPNLVDFGLIYIPHGNPHQYFPTRLATTLTSSGSALRSVSSGFDAASGPNAASSSGLPGAAPDAKGSIILETNYRLYAYTDSPLQIAVLALFTQLKMRFAGMVSGRLTRDSIRRAIGYGITSDQIISYLAAHAHEQMHRVAALQGRPVLPPTVVDQIRLWQLENERMRTTTGFLFKDFEGQAEYDALVQYADEIGVLVWRSDKKQMFFASRHEQLRDYLKLRKKAD
ncbi:RNA polymerase II transcription factor B subunit 2 [Pleurostoma richardsiae]|uniref:RNA polymerase II transcription factor B subunit 2 n=1 Tax=Pleurostoma richardsiae TaxID=41990 RepID=A0AA38RU23_9PEZI|nr:RNA polymerase II transcription factor B subunit 2 [Pleurostoma richardsiae]